MCYSFNEEQSIQYIVTVISKANFQLVDLKIKILIDCFMFICDKHIVLDPTKTGQRVPADSVPFALKRR